MDYSKDFLSFSENAGRVKILVLGLNGLIGWHLFRAAECRGQTWGTYRRRHSQLAKQTHCFRVDMHRPSEVEGLLRHLRPDYLFHAWAMCDLDLCESIPEMAWHTNVEGTRAILQAAQVLPELKKIIYLSTDHVFDGMRGQYHEEDVPNPIHVYGKTKYEAENLVRDSGLPHLIIRPGLVIGQSLQGNKGPRDFLLNRIRAGKPTHYFTDEWRTPVRAERFAAQVLELGLSGQEGTYHLTGTRKFNRYELAKDLAKENGMPTEYIFPRLRREDVWAHIRPENLSLISSKGPAGELLWE